MRDEGPGDGYPLLLSSRQLRRKVEEASADAEHFDASSCIHSVLPLSKPSETSETARTAVVPVP